MMCIELTRVLGHVINKVRGGEVRRAVSTSDVYIGRALEAQSDGMKRELGFDSRT